MQPWSILGAVQVGKDPWRSYSWASCSKQGWLQRVWLASSFPGSRALQGCCVPAGGDWGQAAGLVFSVGSVWLRELGFGFWIATSRNYPDFSGLPFTAAPLLPCLHLVPCCVLFLSCQWYLKAQQHYSAVFFCSSSVASQHKRLFSWHQFDSRAGNFFPFKITPTCNLVGSFLLAKRLFLLFFPT